MGDCAYNGTCSACTTRELEYVETEQNLICCVKDSNSVVGWIRFFARIPSECRESSFQPHVIEAALLAAALVLLLFGVVWVGFKKFRTRDYYLIPPVSPSALPIFQNYQECEQPHPSPSNWEEIELDAAFASMEATTAL